MNTRLRVTLICSGATAMATVLAACLAAACAGRSPQAPNHAPVESILYDVVIRNGRVMDPEWGLDSVADIGVSAGVIGAIGTSPLTGAT